MNIENFRLIMKDSSIKTKFPEGRDNALVGLDIIAKYCPTRGIEGAEHNVIYSVDINELVNAGITKEDAIQLKEINWMIDSNCHCLACFV